MDSWRRLLFGITGMRNFTKAGFEKAQSKFEETLESAAGKCYVITGANSGLGFETASHLFCAGADRIHMLCRSKERGEAALMKIAGLVEDKDRGSNALRLHIVDVSSQESIRAFCDTFDEEIDVLINNAGVLLNERSKTTEGLDATLATNLLGTFALTELLLPKIRQRQGRVVVVSSGGMYTVPLKLDDMEFEKMDPWDGSKAYSITKRQQVCLTEYWAEREREIGNAVSFFSCHPGWAESPGLKSSLPGFYNSMKDKLRDTKDGADTIIYLALSDQIGVEQSGTFFFDREPADKHLFMSGTSGSDTLDNRRLLWERCASYCQLDGSSPSFSASSSSSASSSASSSSASSSS